MESYEDYLKRTGREDNRTSWKYWKMEVCGMDEAEAIKAGIAVYEPLEKESDQAGDL